MSTQEEVEAALAAREGSVWEPADKSRVRDMSSSQQVSDLTSLVPNYFRLCRGTDNSGVVWMYARVDLSFSKPIWVMGKFRHHDDTGRAIFHTEPENSSRGYAYVLAHTNVPQRRLIAITDRIDKAHQPLTRGPYIGFGTTCWIREIGVAEPDDMHESVGLSESAPIQHTPLRLEHCDNPTKRSSLLAFMEFGYTNYCWVRGTITPRDPGVETGPYVFRTVKNAPGLDFPVQKLLSVNNVGLNKFLVSPSTSWENALTGATISEPVLSLVMGSDFTPLPNRVARLDLSLVQPTQHSPLPDLYSQGSRHAFARGPGGWLRGDLTADPSNGGICFRSSTLTPGQGGFIGTLTHLRRRRCIVVTGWRAADTNTAVAVTQRKEEDQLETAEEKLSLVERVVKQGYNPTSKESPTGLVRPTKPNPEMLLAYFACCNVTDTVLAAKEMEELLKSPGEFANGKWPLWAQKEKEMQVAIRAGAGVAVPAVTPTPTPTPTPAVAHAATATSPGIPAGVV